MTDIALEGADASTAALEAVVGTPVPQPAAGQAAAPSITADRLLPTKDVCELIGLSRWAIRRRIAERTFPRPIMLAKNKNVFRASAISEWIATQESRAE